MKKTAKKILSLVLVLAMLFSLTSTAMAGYVAPQHTDGYFYAALGDSVAAGFGITERENYSTMDGFDAWTNYRPENTVRESYPAVFAAQLLAELRDEEIIDELSDFDWANLGVASFQTYDYYRALLDRAWTGTFWSNMLGMWGDAESQKQNAANSIARINRDSLWSNNSKNAANYVANYYKVVSGNATGKELLYTKFGISFDYGKEPWYDAVAGKTGAERDAAMYNWVYSGGHIRSQVKDALIEGIYYNQVKNTASGAYLYHDLFVEQLKKADMITLHIGANDLLEQFMFDLISVAICGSEDNPEAETFGSGVDTASFLTYGIEFNAETGVSECTLYNPAMFLLWIALFSLMEGIDEAAVTAQLVTMIATYQQYITDAHLLEMLDFIDSAALEERIYQNGVAAMRYYDDIVDMIQVGGTFALDPYGKTSDDKDDPYVLAEPVTLEDGTVLNYTNDVTLAALDEEGNPVKNSRGWIEYDAINPDAQIVFIGAFNPFGTNLECEGKSYEFGDVLCSVLQSIFSGLKGGDLNGMSILAGIAEIAGITEADENDDMQTALQKLAEALEARKKSCGCLPIEKDTKVDIFGSVNKVDWSDEDYTVVDEEDYKIKVATVELNGDATTGGADIEVTDSANEGKKLMTVTPSITKFAIMNMAIVNGEAVPMTIIPMGLAEDGNMISEAEFFETYGTRPSRNGRNTKGYNRSTWDGIRNSYTWFNAFSYEFDPAEVDEIDIIMRSIVTAEEFKEYVNTDEGKKSLLDLIGALTASAGQMSFADLASEDIIALLQSIYGVTGLELPNPYDFDSIGTQSYLGLGDIEELLSMELVLAVVLAQVGMGTEEALETAQLLNIVLTEAHFPAMYMLMGQPGLKACNYLNEYVSNVAAERNSPYVSIFEMPNENDFNPHTNIANAAWTADQIFEAIVKRVTVEGAGGEGPGMVYGPNSKRAYNAYDVLFGFDAAFDAVPDRAYKLGEYSIGDGEPVTDFTSNHIVISNIRDDVTLRVKFVEGVDPFSIGAPEGLVAVATTAPDAKDGRILNTTKDMVWDTTPDFNDPKTCGDAVSGLAAGTYYVRYQHGTQYAVVVIEEGQGGADVAPTQVFGIATSKPGAQDGALSRTTKQMEYTDKLVEGGTEPDFTDAITCGDGATRNLKAGTYYVRYIGGTSYVKVTVPDGTGEPDVAPTGLEGVKTSGPGKKDGKIKNTTDKMEYSTDSGFPSDKTFPCANGTTDNLAAGTYYVRYKGGINYTPIEIKEGSSGSGGGGGGGSSSRGGSGTTAPVVVSTVCPRDNTCPIDKFTDTLNDFWWHDGVHYCLEKGLMNGTTTTLFAPTANTTRGMIVAMLWRLEGTPAKAAGTFKDVDYDMYYGGAISWAQATGVVNGYDEETFGPEDFITREQMAAILWRYAKYKGYDVSVGENTNILSYEDADQVSTWAMSAMQWACGSGLLQGYNNLLTPIYLANRAEVATMFMRYCQNSAK